MEDRTIIVPLTRGKFAIIDEADAPLVLTHKWQASKSVRDTWYAHTHIRRNGKRFSIAMHRLIMGDPPGVQIDHKDHDGLNNRRSNLREATRAQQMANRRVFKNQSGYRGVCRRKDATTWRAQIGVDGRTIQLGSFRRIEDAARAYDEAARHYFGEFATLNFPDTDSQTPVTPS